MKISITKIEHVSWAKRLIIDFYMPYAASQPSKGEWIYLLNKCGYKGVCDEEWIVMDPNWQHPLHSDKIVAPGKNTFVWDYGGVQGIDPKAFDSEHSYILQIAAIDSSCDWTDPCVLIGYETPSTSPIPGAKPEGQLGSQGNCGPGYVVSQNVFGCLFCEKKDLGGSTPDDPPAPGLGGFSTNKNPEGELHTPPIPGPPGLYPTPTVPIPPDPRTPPGPTGPPGPGPLTGKGPFDVPYTDTPGGGTPPPIPKPRRPKTPIDPESGVRPSGDPPYSGIEDGPSEVTHIYGDNGFGNTDVVREETYRGEGWMGHNHGGVEPGSNPDNDWININAYTPLELYFETALEYEVEPNKNLALNIGPKRIPVTEKSSTTRVPGLDKVLKNTKPIESIVRLSDGSVVIKGKEGSVTRSVNINANPNALSNARLRPAPGSSEYTGRSASSPYTPKDRAARTRGADSPSERRSVGNRSRETDKRRLIQDVRNIGHATAFRNSEDFNANYIIKLIAAPIANGMIFVDARVDIRPRVKKTIRLTLYIVQEGKAHMIAETGLIESLDPRCISKRISSSSVNSGQLVTIVATIDDGNKVIGRAAESFILTDYGAAQAGGSYVPQGRGAYKQAIETLIRSNDSIDVIIGRGPVVLVANVASQSSDLVELGAYSISKDGMSKHSIDIYNQSDAALTTFNNIAQQFLTFSSRPIVSNTGPLKIPGLPIRDSKYAGGVWSGVESSMVESSLLVVLKSQKQSDYGRAKVYLGKGLSFPTLAIASSDVSGESGTFSFTFTTPYANASLTIYEAGGNNIVPSAATETTFTTDLAGSGSTSLTIASIPTWIAIAVAGDAPLYDRTLGWFKV
jgi:hypothetical protein